MMRCFDRLGKLNAAIHITLKGSAGATLVISHNHIILDYVKSSRDYVRYFKAFYPNLNWDTVVICK
jgi:hypothetical protein